MGYVIGIVMSVVMILSLMLGVSAVSALNDGRVDTVVRQLVK